MDSIENSNFATTFGSVNESIPNIDDPDLFDHFCDLNKPKKIKFEDIEIRYPDIFKKEFIHRTGSFKERGARNALLNLTGEQRMSGVITASAGNHALALAYHGRELNIHVTVVMPIAATLMKINNCVIYGSEVILKGNDICEARRLAMKLAKKRNLLYINGYDHPDVIAGQGTMGLQVAEQIEDIDAIIIPIGGGGLLAGTAVALKTLNHDILIYGVESEKCPSFYNSIKAGKPTFTHAEPSIADGLSVPMVGVNAFHTCKELIDRIIIVEEEFIALAIVKLIESEKIIVEGSGAASLAPILAGKVPELKGKKVVIALCGGNIDTTILGRVIERGLAFAGRLIRFVVVIPDVPGSINKLTTLLLEQGVSIKDIFHERAWLTSDIFSVQVKCVCETRDMDHALNLKKYCWKIIKEFHGDLE